MAEDNRSNILTVRDQERVKIQLWNLKFDSLSTVSKSWNTTAVARCSIRRCICFSRVVKFGYDRLELLFAHNGYGVFLREFAKCFTLTYRFDIEGGACEKLSDVQRKGVPRGIHTIGHPLVAINKTPSQVRPVRR